MQWLRRLLHHHTPQIPDALWETCIGRLPFLHRLSAEELRHLKQLSENLLDKIGISGAGGLDLSDEIAVVIATQAALPVLHLTPELYKDMAGIIVYPGEFIVSQSEIDEAGVLHEWQEPISGEAVQAGGAIVLSWEDVDAATPDYNVVIHEFAHKIDMGYGNANGSPPFLADYHQGLDARVWQQVFTGAYQDFVARVEHLERQLPDDFDPEELHHAKRYEELFGELPLDPYAAEDPAEFFAVATEAFFVLPEPLAQDYPEVYRLLARYYRQDPLASR